MMMISADVGEIDRAGAGDLAITPSNSLVVALPRILGPTMEKTVEAMASSHTSR